MVFRVQQLIIAASGSRRALPETKPCGHSNLAGAACGSPFGSHQQHCRTAGSQQPPEAPAQDGASSKLRGSTLMSLQQQGGPGSTATAAATWQGDISGHPHPSMPGLAQSAAGSPVSIPGLDAEVPLSQARESRSLPPQEMHSNSPPDAMQLPSAATEDAAAQGEIGIAPASVSGTGTHTSTEDNSTAAARDGEDGARQGGMTGPAAAPGMPGGADLTIDSAHSFWRERAQQHLTMQRQRAADLKRQQRAHQHALEQSKALSSAQARGDLTQEQQQLQLQIQQLTQHVPEGAYAEGPDNRSAVPEQHKDVQQPRQSSLGASSAAQQLESAGGDPATRSTQSLQPMSMPPSTSLTISPPCTDPALRTSAVAPDQPAVLPADAAPSTSPPIAADPHIAAEGFAAPQQPHLSQADAACSAYYSAPQTSWHSVPYQPRCSEYTWPAAYPGYAAAQPAWGGTPSGQSGAAAPPAAWPTYAAA